MVAQSGLATQVRPELPSSSLFRCKRKSRTRERINPRPKERLLPNEAVPLDNSTGRQSLGPCHPQKFVQAMLGAKDSRDREISSIRWGNVGLVILDAVVTKDLTSLISAIRARDPLVRIVVFSSVDDWKRAREAILAGAVDFAVKCLDEEQIVDILTKDLLQKVPPVAITTSEVRGVS